MATFEDSSLRSGLRGEEFLEAARSSQRLIPVMISAGDQERLPMSTVRLVRNSAMPALLAMAVGCSMASAETLTQTQPFSGLSNVGLPLSWNQFNPASGTLTGISLTITGTASGSFKLTNTDAVDPAGVSDPKARLRLTFSGSGAPGVQQTNQTTLTTSPSMPFNLSQESNQTFSLSPDPQSLGLASNSLFAAASYFTGVGTVSSSLLELFTVTSNNAGFTESDFSNLVAAGNVQLVYTFQPVPEPSTYALAAIGLGLAAFTRARRRKAAV